MFSFTLYVRYLEKHVLSSVISVSLPCKGVRGRKTWWDCLYHSFSLLPVLLNTVARNHWLIATDPNVCLFCSVTWTESTTSIALSTTVSHEKKKIILTREGEIP